MPDVFTDEVGTYDLSITTTADWTVSSGGMPNGDNYVTGDGTMAATYNVNGDDFDLRTGSWSIEFWVYIVSAPASNNTILMMADPGDTAGGCYQIYLDTSRVVNFVMYTSGGGVYVSRTSAALSTGTWHHLVCIKVGGSATTKMYIDNVNGGTGGGSGGTPKAPTVSSRLYLGSAADGTNDVTSTVRWAKLAIYDFELTAGQVNDHYLAMTAA